MRFVILNHDWPEPHWDFLLETDVTSALRTWRLLEVPQSGSGIPAERIADHRRLYLDYEGPVSGGRGTVSRWDCGRYQRLSESPGRLTLQLFGGKISGQVDIIESATGEQFVFSPTSPGSEGSV